MMRGTLSIVSVLVLSSQGVFAANLDLVTDPAIGEPERFAVSEIRREAMAKGITLGDDARAIRVFLTIEKDTNVAA